MTLNNLITKCCISLWILTALVSCTGEHYSDVYRVSATAPVDEPGSTDADTVWINIGQSKVAWKGTKMWGRGMHERNL